MKLYIRPVWGDSGLCGFEVCRDPKHVLVDEDIVAHFSPETSGAAIRECVREWVGPECVVEWGDPIDIDK